ncbi:MAG: DUF333 domain-containing protein [Methanotrichaceae archaeon]|nr:DUF333 domain-containing protein [Methanotrichaceae archaeon]
MISGLYIKIGRISFVGLCALILLAIGTMNCVGEEGVSNGLTESSESQAAESQAAHDYCVQMGYLYKTTPTLNNGQPICQFTKTTWCDANAFYTGQCTGSYNPYGLPNPYATYYGYPSSASVHTPYGDVPANVPYGGYIYVTEPYYYGGWSETGAEQAAWMYGAISFLNAP